MRAIDILPTMYGAGIVCMMLNSQNRRIGDFVAGTVVIHDQRTEEVRPDWTPRPKPLRPVRSSRLLTSDDLVLIETYLQRRFQLDRRYETVLRCRSAFASPTRPACSAIRRNRRMTFWKRSPADSDSARFR